MTMYPRVLKQGDTFLTFHFKNYTGKNTNTLIGFTSNRKATEFINKVVNQYQQKDDGTLMYMYAKKGLCSKLEFEIPLKKKNVEITKYELFADQDDEFFHSLIRHSIHCMTIKDFYIDDSNLLRIQGVQVEFSCENVDHLNLYDYNVRVLNNHII